jgi:branched-chain amino acid transport system ATP-binding protein
MALLELDGVEAAYGAVKVLHGISFTVEEKEIVAVLGANGAGKTTTLRAISGTVRRTGQIRFQGQPLNERSPEDIVRLGIAHVPEGRGTLSQFTVWDNLRMGAYLRRDQAGVKRDCDRVFSYFPRLAQRRTQVAGSLSGGEQQMLALARALLLPPRLLLLDEPSLGLAPILVREIFRILRTINQEEGMAVLVVEQNAALALAASQRAHVLETGRVALSGLSAELRTNEAVRRTYLGY